MTPFFLVLPVVQPPGIRIDVPAFIELIFDTRFPSHGWNDAEAVAGFAQAFATPKPNGVSL